MKELLAISAAFVILHTFDRSKIGSPRSKHKYPAMEGYIRREQRTLKIVADE